MLTKIQPSKSMPNYTVTPAKGCSIRNFRGGSYASMGRGGRAPFPEAPTMGAIRSNRLAPFTPWERLDVCQTRDLRAPRWPRFVQVIGGLCRRSAGDCGWQPRGHPGNSDRMLEMLLKRHRPEKYRERNDLVTRTGRSDIDREIRRLTDELDEKVGRDRPPRPA